MTDGGYTREEAIALQGLGKSGPDPMLGHNLTGSDGVGAQGRDALRSFIERIENIEGEVANLNADKREVYAEAKALGFDTKIMRKAIMRRRADKNEVAQEDQLLSLYEDALRDLQDAVST